MDDLGLMLSSDYTTKGRMDLRWLTRALRSLRDFDRHHSVDSS